MFPVLSVGNKKCKNKRANAELMLIRALALDLLPKKCKKKGSPGGKSARATLESLGN